MSKKKFNAGDKVMWKDKEKYDFGYYSQTPGNVILYKEGERNMQDSVCVYESDIKLATYKQRDYHNEVVEMVVEWTKKCIEYHVKPFPDSVPISREELIKELKQLEEQFKIKTKK